MSKAADSAAADRRGILGEIEDFGQSALHTAIESPINGAIQFIDHAANVHLPELELIGAPKHNSIGSKAGAVVGAAVDLVAISVLTGGVADIIGAAGVAGGIGTAAATGAIYGGILTPSDNNSKHFFQDRLINGGISAATFAAMGGAARALNATGAFAVPEVRSLVGSLTFGGLSGAAGGLVNAEATAVLKAHKPVPSLKELATTVGTQTLFGAAYGGLGYAVNQVVGPASRPTEMKSGQATLNTITDARGETVGFESRMPWPRYPHEYDAVWQATKMTDGTWKSSEYFVDKWGELLRKPDFPKIETVERGSDGTLVVGMLGEDARTYTPYGYETGTLARERAEFRIDHDARYFDRVHSDGERDVVSKTNGFTKLDAQGNTVKFAKEWEGSGGARLSYDTAGTMNTVSMSASEQGDPYIYLSRSTDSSWTMTKGNDVYTWNGTIEQIKTPEGFTNGLKITPRGAEPMTFDTSTGTAKISAAIESTLKYSGIRPYLGWAKVAPNGDLIVKSGAVNTVSINGQVVTGETVVKAGDILSTKINVGDAFTEWEIRQLKVGKSPDGKVTLNNKQVNGRAIDIGDFH